MKKKLLSEAQVRRFMGLAGINAVNEAAYKAHDDADKDHGKKMEEGEGHMEEDVYEELMEEEDEDEDLGVEMEDSDADIDIPDEKVEDFLDAAATIKDMADMLSGAVGGADMPEDEEDEEEPDLDGAGIEMDQTPEEKEEEEEQIVNEVARRVAKRILEAKHAHKRMNEALGRSRRRK